MPRRRDTGRGRGIRTPATAKWARCFPPESSSRWPGAGRWRPRWSRRARRERGLQPRTRKACWAGDERAGESGEAVRSKLSGTTAASGTRASPATRCAAGDKSANKNRGTPRDAVRDFPASGTGCKALRSHFTQRGDESRLSSAAIVRELTSSERRCFSPLAGPERPH